MPWSKKFQVAEVFAQITIAWLRTFGKSTEEINAIKQQWAQKVLQVLGFEIQIVGQAPAFGSAILVGNHISYLDIVVLMAALPEVTFIAKNDILRWPLIGTVAKTIGTIFVERKAGSDRATSRKEIFAALAKSNTKVVVFPSGTTTLREERRWKTGIFEIAKAANTPLQLFKVDYFPLRPSAYIDQDHLLTQLHALQKYQNKVAHLTWMEKVTEIDDPVVLAEQLRLKVQRDI